LKIEFNLTEIDCTLLIDCRLQIDCTEIDCTVEMYMHAITNTEISSIIFC